MLLKVCIQKQQFKFSVVPKPEMNMASDAAHNRADQELSQQKQHRNLEGDPTYKQVKTFCTNYPKLKK